MNAPTSHKGIIAWFAENSVAANLLMLLVIGAGLFSLSTITKKTMPDIDRPVIQVRIAYPGASPADVESGILLQVEKAVDDVDGITRVSSVASEGSGSVNIEVDESFDINDVLNNVKVRVDGILTFPVDAEPPIVSRNVVRSDALRLEVFGDMDPVSQKELAQQIRDELLLLPNVTSVTLSGARAYEIAIEVPDPEQRAVQRILPVTDSAVSTSGDYRNFFKSGGKRYSHHIDPRTGVPVEQRLASVTVILPGGADSARRADGLATALMVMGEARGPALAEAQGIAAYFILREAQGFRELTTPAFDRITENDQSANERQ